MARYCGYKRVAVTLFSILAIGAVSGQTALGQFTWVTDSAGGWADPNSWNPNTGFPNAPGAVANFIAPLRTGSGGGNYVIPLAGNNITVGEIFIDNSAFDNSYNVNFTTTGGQLTFNSGSASPAKYTETAGTGGSSRYTWNPVINVESDWEMDVDNVPNLNTGTQFTNLVNGDATRTITKNGVGNIQFNSNLGLLPGEGFAGKMVINQGTVRLIGTDLTTLMTGITVNDGGQLQLADNAGTMLPNWNLAPGAVLKLNGTGKGDVPGQASRDGALRIGIQDGRTTTFHNPVELESDSNIHVASTNRFGVLSNTVSGPGSLNKTGAGKLTLTGTNTYTGDTRASEGVLSITSAFLHDNADVYLATGATLDLGFADTDTIRSLYIDGIGQATGVWGPTGSGAANETDLLTGIGLLNVTMLPVVGIPGDYNDNGSVDAADYILWRKGGPLANEVDNPGTVDALDFVEWKARFGNPGSGLGASHTIPEPSAMLLALLAYCGALSGRSRGRNNRG